MVTTTDSLTRRIVSRYLRSQSSCRSGPNRRAFIWNQPAPRAHIPDNIAVQCSSKCTLKAQELEQMLPAKLKIAPGSCRIVSVHADTQTNRTRFEAETNEGRKVTGTITVNIVATDLRVDAFSVVDLD